MPEEIIPIEASPDIVVEIAPGVSKTVFCSTFATFRNRTDEGAGVVEFAVGSEVNIPLPNQQEPCIRTNVADLYAETFEVYDPITQENVTLSGAAVFAWVREAFIAKWHAANPPASEAEEPATE